MIPPVINRTLADAEPGRQMTRNHLRQMCIIQPYIVLDRLQASAGTRIFRGKHQEASLPHQITSHLAMLDPEGGGPEIKQNRGHRPP